MRRIRRRRFLASASLALAAPTLSVAQQRTSLYRVGVLVAPPAAAFAARTDALRAGLQELGYLQGKNMQIELRSAEGKSERLPELATELVRQDVDVIVAAGTPAIRAAKQATATIPIVMAAVGDAVAGGLVASLARPGANITGSTYFAPELGRQEASRTAEGGLSASDTDRSSSAIRTIRRWW